MSSLVLLLWAGAAQARVYGTPIDVQSESDLEDLVSDGILTEDDYETLKDLLDQPLDINRARRGDLYELPGLALADVDAILAWRKQNGPFPDLSALTQAGISDDAIAQLHSFAVALPPQQREKIPIRGRARTRVAAEFERTEVIEEDNPGRTHTVEQLGYHSTPQMYALAEVDAWRWLSAGAAVVARPDVQGMTFDEEHGAFLLDWGPTVELGRAYAFAHRLRLDAVVGSYSAGFGLGLTFDQTSRAQPHGLYPEVSISGTEDFGFPRRLFGAGVRGFDLPLGAVHVDGTVWVASTRYDVYQYDLGLAYGDSGTDPLTDELGSPRAFLDGQRVGYITFPNLIREDLAGGNATVRLDDRTHLGVTGWAGRQDRSLVEGTTGDYSYLLRDTLPADLVYGAVGADASWGSGPVDVLAELAHSSGGGNAFEAQILADIPKMELETTLRRFGTDFDNAHARGEANADQYGGQRDRDEQGVKVKANLQPIKPLNIRSTVDVWQTIHTGAWNADLYARVQYKVDRDIVLAAFGQHRDRTLGVGGRSAVYGGEDQVLEEGEGYGEDLGATTEEDSAGTDTLYERAGSREDWGLSARVDKVPHTSLSAFYRRTYEDAGMLYPNDGGPCEYWYQIGQYTWFKVRYEPLDDTDLTLRVRYRDDDVHGSADDRQLETYLQVEQKLPKRVKVGMRGTLGWDLPDDPAAWADSCKRGGAPDLVEGGTCVVDLPAEESTSEAQPYGALWLSAEVRF